jgi:hypothetical protein
MTNSQILTGSLAVFLILCLIVLLYVTFRRIYSPLYAGFQILDEPVAMTNNMNDCNEKFPIIGIEHTYSFWFFITQWDVSTEKRIFMREHDRNINLTIKLDKVEPNLMIQIDQDGKRKDQTHIVRDIRLQGWNHVSMTIWDKVLDVYVNGKLVRTFLLSTAITPKENGAFKIGGESKGSRGSKNKFMNIPTFEGFMSRFLYFPRVVTPQEIYKTYLRGPTSMSNLSKTPGAEIGMDLIVNTGTGRACSKSII